MAIKNVAHLGANGTLGPAVLQALTSAVNFSVTVLSRSSSKSVYPDSVHVVRIPDEPTEEDLLEALKGQDAVVVTTAGSYSDLQIRLADAAVKAGVQFFIPADFGSCDSSSERALELIPLYRAKQKVRQHLQRLAESNQLSWASLVCGHFFDYGMKTGLLSVDLVGHKIRIFDGGSAKWSTTRLDVIATAVVRVLQNPDKVYNRMLYIQSFSLTQNRLLDILQRITGQKWHVDHEDSAQYIKAMKAVLDKDPGSHEANENLVSVVGMIDGDWESKKDFANPILGLDDEDPHDQIKAIIQGNSSTYP